MAWNLFTGSFLDAQIFGLSSKLEIISVLTCARAKRRERAISRVVEPSAFGGSTAKELKDREVRVINAKMKWAPSKLLIRYLKALRIRHVTRSLAVSLRWIHSERAK